MNVLVWKNYILKLPLLCFILLGVKTFQRFGRNIKTFVNYLVSNNRGSKAAPATPGQIKRTPVVFIMSDTWPGIYKYKKCSHIIVWPLLTPQWNGFHWVECQSGELLWIRHMAVPWLTMYCTLNTAFFTLHTAHCTLHTSHWTLLTTYYTLNTTHCTLHCFLGAGSAHHEVNFPVTVDDLQSQPFSAL